MAVAKLGLYITQMDGARKYVNNLNGLLGNDSSEVFYNLGVDDVLKTLAISKEIELTDELDEIIELHTDHNNGGVTDDVFDIAVMINRDSFAFGFIEGYKLLQELINSGRV